MFPKNLSTKPKIFYTFFNQHLARQYIICLTMVFCWKNWYVWEGKRYILYSLQAIQSKDRGKQRKKWIKYTYKVGGIEVHG